MIGTTTVSVGLTAQKAMDLAAKLKKAAQDAIDRRVDNDGRPTVFEVTIEAENNTENEGPVILSFTNDDMEGRPTVADRILVDIEEA